MTESDISLYKQKLERTFTMETGYLRNEVEFMSQFADMSETKKEVINSLLETLNQQIKEYVNG